MAGVEMAFISASGPSPLVQPVSLSAKRRDFQKESRAVQRGVGTAGKDASGVNGALEIFGEERAGKVND